MAGVDGAVVAGAVVVEADVEEAVVGVDTGRSDPGMMTMGTEGRRGKRITVVSRRLSPRTSRLEVLVWLSNLFLVVSGGLL